jgi:hypothetical protein
MNYSCPEEAEFMSMEDVEQEAEGEAAYAAQCEAGEQAKIAFEEIERQETRKIVLYVTDLYPRCHDLASWLDAQGIPFETRNLADPAARADLLISGFYDLQSAPVLKIGEMYYGAAWLFADDKMEEGKIVEVLQ